MELTDYIQKNLDVSWYVEKLRNSYPGFKEVKLYRCDRHDAWFLEVSYGHNQSNLICAYLRAKPALKIFFKWSVKEAFINLINDSPKNHVESITWA